MSKLCEFCQHWLFAYKNFEGNYGTCDHPLVEDKIVLDKENEDETVIHTHQYFGCIYHEPQGGYMVTKLPIPKTE